MTAVATGRARPLLRSKLSRFVVAIAAICLCGYGWYLHLEAEPRIAIPPPSAMPVPNAYEDLARIAALNFEPSEDMLASFSPRRGAPKSAVPFTDSDRQAALARAEPALNALRTALAAHAYRAPTRRGPGTRDLVAFKARDLARTLSFESKMRERGGDYAGAASSAIDIVQLAMAIPRGGAITARLISYAIESIGQFRLLAAVDHLDAAQAAAAAQRLEAVVAARVPLADSLKEEKRWNLTDLSLRLAKSTTFGAYHDLRAELDSELENAGGGTDYQPSAEEARAMRLQTFKDWCALLTLSKQNVVDDAARVLDASIASARLPAGAPHSPDEAITDPILLYAIMPMRNRAAETMDARFTTTNAFCLTDLAIHAYRLQHGVCPASLADLTTSHILRALPDDPFASAFGVPLRYRLLDPTHFLLYSVGSDGVDDGGRPITSSAGGPSYMLSDSDKGDWVFGVNVNPPAKRAP